MPAPSATARPPPPAITPVPGDAGRNSTRAPSYSPITSCGIVFSFNETFSIDLRENTIRSEEHTSELQSRSDLVCRLLLEKKTIIYTRFPCSLSPHHDCSLIQLP